MIKKPYIIGIAGESGVGKSTISGIISLFIGEKNTCVLSTDDLHKWERTNSAWNAITHLNPEANNLELGDIHLADLAKGGFVYRSVYNHKTGSFDPPKKIEAKSTIINEGLHAFYTEATQSLTDLKIFIDTDEELRTHWKLIRDTEERGYKYNDVLDAIEKRRADNANIRNQQMAVADVVIQINSERKITRLGDKHDLVPLKVTVHNLTNKAEDNLLSFIQQYMMDFGGFIKASEKVGHDVEMCQNGGGNISVKSGLFMIIKASGFNMKDVHRLNGYSVLTYNDFLNHKISNDIELNQVMLSATGSKYKRPSMETGMHAVLDKYVLHAHPIYTTLILCLRNSRQLIAEIYEDLKSAYISYAKPGYDLFDFFRRIEQEYEVFFLENHGVVVTGKDVDKATSLLFEINNRARRYLEQSPDFEPFDLYFANRQAEGRHAFPDSVMFWNDPIKRETVAAHNYINIVGERFGHLRYLDETDVRSLLSMESEKYRKTL